MHSTTTGRMQVVCGSCIRWLVSRTSSCADKLGGDWGRDEVQRTTKRYDDDGHVKDVWLRLLLLAAVVVAARALPPQTNRRRMSIEKRHWAKHSQLSVEQGYGARLCAFNLLHTI